MLNSIIENKLKALHQKIYDELDITLFTNLLAKINIQKKKKIFFLIHTERALKITNVLRYIQDTTPNRTKYHRN